MRSQFVLSEIWIGLRRNLTMTMALIVVVAISLSLLGTGLLFVKQVDNTRSYWPSRVNLSVYLCSSQALENQCAKTGQVTAAEIAAIQAELKTNKDISQVTYLDQQHAWQQFKQEFQGSQTVNDVTPDQIPESFQIKLKNTEADAAQVSSIVSGYQGVAEVVDDSSILNNFYRLLDGARNAVVIIALFLLVAAILLVANTIRLSALNRRRGTSIMRLGGWLVASGLLIAVESLWLNGLQSYVPFGGTLTSSDLIEVVIIALITGLLICGSTSFLT